MKLSIQATKSMQPTVGPTLRLTQKRLRELRNGRLNHTPPWIETRGCRLTATAQRGILDNIPYEEGNLRQEEENPRMTMMTMKGEATVTRKKALSMKALSMKKKTKKKFTQDTEPPDRA
jgi:hypothetical protein